MVSVLHIKGVNYIPLLLAPTGRTLLELWVICPEVQPNKYRAACGKTLDRIQVRCDGSAEVVEYGD